MMSNLMEKIIEESIEEGYKGLKDVQGYDVAVNDFNNHFEELLRIVPKENKNIVMNIESASTHVCIVENEYFFRLGIKEGMELFKSIKSIAADIHTEPLDFGVRVNDRTTEIFNEYKKQVTGSLECNKDSFMYDFIKKYRHDFQSELLMYMYRQAFEDGRKQGYKEALT